MSVNPYEPSQEKELLSVWGRLELSEYYESQYSWCWGFWLPIAGCLTLATLPIAVPSVFLLMPVIWWPRFFAQGLFYGFRKTWREFDERKVLVVTSICWPLSVYLFVKYTPPLLDWLNTMAPRCHLWFWDTWQQILDLS